MNDLKLTGYVHGLKMVKNGVCQFTLMFEVRGKKIKDRPFIRCVMFAPKGKTFFDNLQNSDRVLLSGTLDGDVSVEEGTGFKKVQYQFKVEDWEKTIRRTEQHQETPRTTPSDNPNLPPVVNDEGLNWIE